MGYSYKSYSDTKEVFKKFVNAAEGQAVYGISRSHIMEMAKKAGAVYKVGNTALINTEIFEAFLILNLQVCFTICSNDILSTSYASFFIFLRAIIANCS